MIRLLVSDVDGTLVEESQSALNPEYFTLIPQLKAKGIQVVAASGRPYSSMAKLFAPVLEDMWFISDCGATMQTSRGLEYNQCIPKATLAELWADISQIPTGDGMICGKDKIYIPQKDSQMCKIVRDDYKMEVKYLAGWEDLPQEESGKVSLFCPEDVEILGQALREKWQGKLHSVISGEWWLDFMMPQVNKGTAVEKIMAEYGYAPEEIMATGDNMNDIELLKVAGTALAVSTAREEVKAIATRVIGSYKEDAVLEEWKKLL